LAPLPEEASHRIAYVGGRIAAKEAVAKAMGTGFSGDVTWADVEVLKGEEVTCTVLS
jgi:phosphopantetheinyl transferase (holo-ACP synthase)